MTDNKGINHILQEDVVVEQNMVCITEEEVVLRHCGGRNGGNNGASNVIQFTF